MSNGDDVLDNWEEFDEAGLQSTFQSLKDKKSPQSSSNTSLTKPTENLNTSVLAKPGPTMKLLQRSSQDSPVLVANRSSAATNSVFAKSPLEDMSATFQPVLMVLHKPDDEYQSANYTQPIANQTVKILRRPTQSSEPRNNGMRPKQPIKTLKQREQEYAEARLRILGEAKNPEDEEQKAASVAAINAGVGTNAANIASNATPTTPVAAFAATPVTNVAGPPTSKLNSPKTQGGPNMYNNLYQYQQQQQQQLQQQQQMQLHHTQPPNPYQQQAIFHANFQQQQQQQQQQQNFFYNQQPPTPAYNNVTNNNRTFTSMPLLGHGPMGAIGQPAQYQQVATSQAVTAQAALQQQMKMQQQQQQYHHKSSQQQIQKQQQQQQQLQQQTWSPVVGGSVSSSSIRQQQQNESILRLPRGPDGSVGFQQRR